MHRAMSHKSEAPTEGTSMEFVLSDTAMMPVRGTPMTAVRASMAGGSPATAFTEMMEGAGFKKGEPFFVASEGRPKDF